MLARVALTAGALVIPTVAAAQVGHEGHDSSAHGEHRAASMSRPFGIPMTRMGSDVLSGYAAAQRARAEAARPAVASAGP